QFSAVKPKSTQYTLEEDNQLPTETVFLSTTVHANLITHTNKDDTLLIWKFWNHFSYLAFDNNKILSFITKNKAAIEQLHEVGISRDPDIIAYEILKKTSKNSRIYRHFYSNYSFCKFLYLPMIQGSVNIKHTTLLPIIPNLNVGNFILTFVLNLTTTINPRNRRSTVSAHFSLHNPIIYSPLSLIRDLLLT
ncbi:hypothetical protein VP01_5040g1, partial [Puccinia sorghi]